MTPDELLTYLESELARCRAERDRLRAEMDAGIAERDRALQKAFLDNARLDRMLYAAERERDRLYGELQGVLGSKSWLLTKPVRRMLGSDRPEAVDGP